MDVQDAIQRAKAFVGVAFADEGVAQVRTEEIEFDSARNSWLITLGLMRPAIDTRSGQIASFLGNAVLKRSCRVFVVNAASGNVDAVKIKQFDEGRNARSSSTPNCSCCSSLEQPARA